MSDGFLPISYCLFPADPDRGDDIINVSLH
jgi:hypothetical protein